jgi:hypothetical protein
MPVRDLRAPRLQYRLPACFENHPFKVLSRSSRQETCAFGHRLRLELVSDCDPREHAGRPLPGPTPVKTQAALRVAEPLLSAPVTNRVNWTLARLADEIAAREGVTISRSQLSKALRKKGAFAIGDPATR